jgi:hypothetical protein
MGELTVSIGHTLRTNGEVEVSESREYMISVLEPGDVHVAVSANCHVRGAYRNPPEANDRDLNNALQNDGSMRRLLRL